MVFRNIEFFKAVRFELFYFINFLNKFHLGHYQASQLLKIYLQNRKMKKIKKSLTVSLKGILWILFRHIV
jgi:hypothetical protein